MKPDWRLCTLTWIALLLGETRVFAEASAAARETARSAMDEADRLRSAGDHRAALARYRAADDIMHVPTTGIEVAREQAELGWLVEARATAIQTANLPAGPAEPSVFTEARAVAVQLAAELEPRIPSLSTLVSPSDADYSLSIDKVDMPSQARSLPFRTNPGPHEVVVKAAGYATATIIVPLAEAERRSLTVTLHAVAPPTAAAAQPRRESRALTADAADPGQAGRIRGYVGISVGGAVFTTGVVAGIASALETSDLKRACQGSVCPDWVASKLHRANALANVANVCLPVGLLVMGYGVWELLTAPTTPRPASANSLHLQASAHGAYAEWQGTL